MKKLKMLYRSAKLLVAYWFIAKGNRLVVSVASGLVKDGYAQEAFLFVANHHYQVGTTHFNLLKELTGPLEERPKVTTDASGVEMTDWTETPTSKRVLEKAMPSLVGTERAH